VITPRLGQPVPSGYQQKNPVAHDRDLAVRYLVLLPVHSFRAALNKRQGASRRFYTARRVMQGKTNG
jgi:hypothetical protein